MFGPVLHPPQLQFNFKKPREHINIFAAFSIFNKVLALFNSEVKKAAGVSC